MTKRRKKVSRQVQKNRNRALHMNAAYVVFLAIAATIVLLLCVNYVRLQSELTKHSKNVTALQEELDDVALFLVDVDDVIEEKAASASGETATKTPSYNPAPGTEKMVHLSLVRGRRFNPLTGKEESKVVTQLFTFAEWQLFKKNYKNLGYTIIAALHDPYGDAAEIVTKN